MLGCVQTNPQVVTVYANGSLGANFRDASKGCMRCNWTDIGQVSSAALQLLGSKACMRCALVCLHCLFSTDNSHTCSFPTPAHQIHCTMQRRNSSTASLSATVAPWGSIVIAAVAAQSKSRYSACKNKQTANVGHLHGLHESTGCEERCCPSTL